MGGIFEVPGAAPGVKVTLADDVAVRDEAGRRIGTVTDVQALEHGSLVEVTFELSDMAAIRDITPKPFYSIDSDGIHAIPARPKDT